jgi:hypothetical protein
MITSVFSNVLYAIVAAYVILVSQTAADHVGIRAENPRTDSRNPILDKTWTTRGQEKTAGPQVLDISPLTSRVSFQAEGKGFEPSTGQAGT